MKGPLILSGILFDWIEERWMSRPTQRFLASLLVTFFVTAIVVIELNRRGILPEPFSGIFATTHLAAIQQAFNLVLALEVMELIFSLAHSVTKSLGKQFEILSLILLRDTFKELSHLSEPLAWEQVAPSIIPIVSTAMGALAIFVILGLYYRWQKSHPFSGDEGNRKSFILAKKSIALVLLVSFLGIGVYDLWMFFAYSHPENVFEMLYTLLIFSDVLIVLISLRYSSHYLVAFRNSGFAVATVLIRLALIAPVTIGAALGVGTALFALGISQAYNYFVPAICEECGKKG